MRTLAVLPSRYAASRFPGKPLVSIAGKPMIQWAWESVASAKGVDHVAVATDDERIAQAVRAFGGDVVMTDPALPSGTDRVACAMDALSERGENFDLVLNIQGDEPAMHPGTVAAVVALMAAQKELDMGTAACPFNSWEDVFNPNIVKVVTNDRQRALYFSRSPIPYLRNSQIFEMDFRPWARDEQLKMFKRHLGIYAYRPLCLKAFTALRPHALESFEMLEQLRALMAGMSLGVAMTEHVSLGVDTPEDVAVVEALLKAQGRVC